METVTNNCKLFNANLKHCRKSLCPCLRLRTCDVLLITTTIDSHSAVTSYVEELFAIKLPNGRTIKPYVLHHANIDMKDFNTTDRDLYSVQYACQHLCGLVVCYLDASLLDSPWIRDVKYLSLLESLDKTHRLVFLFPDENNRRRAESVFHNNFDFKTPSVLKNSTPDENRAILKDVISSNTQRTGGLLHKRLIAIISSISGVKNCPAVVNTSLNNTTVDQKDTYSRDSTTTSAYLPYNNCIATVLPPCLCRQPATPKPRRRRHVSESSGQLTEDVDKCPVQECRGQTVTDVAAVQLLLAAAKCGQKSPCMYVQMLGKQPSCRLCRLSVSSNFQCNA